MKNKGIGIIWFIAIAGMLIMIAASAFYAATGFQQYFESRKRALEEEILNFGNEMETDARLLQQVGTLITWQVLHDVGRNYLLNQDDLFFADTYNHPKLFVDYRHRIDLLPYWDVIPQERIIADIEKASRNLLSNYLRNMTDFYDELNEHPFNRRLGATRDVDACIITDLELDEYGATLDFSSVTFAYRSRNINLIEIEAPIKSWVATHFQKIMEISQVAIDKLIELARPPSVPRGPVTIRNGESYDVDLGVLLSVKDKPTGLGPDLRLNIIPPSREDTPWSCCRIIKGNQYYWRSGWPFQCGNPKVEERAEVYKCAGLSVNDWKQACASRCPELGPCNGAKDNCFDYVEYDCTCHKTNPPIRRIEFLKNKPEDQGAVGRKGSDCKDPSLPYFSSVDVNNGDTFCLRTKEFDVKPSCIKEEERGRYLGILDSQDSKCELHTAVFGVSIIDPQNNFDNIIVTGNYLINTIIQQKHANAVVGELETLARTPKYNFDPDIVIDAFNGTNWIRITEEESKQVPLYIYGTVRKDNIGLEFLVDTEIPKWTMKPPKYKLDQKIICPEEVCGVKGSIEKPFADIARLVWVDAGLAFRSDSLVFRWMYAQAKEFICAQQQLP